MESEGSLLHAKESDGGLSLSTEPEWSNPNPTNYFPKINFNIHPTAVPKISEWPLLFILNIQHLRHVILLPDEYIMAKSSSLTWSFQ
jgi:hypothetical protein